MYSKDSIKILVGCAPCQPFFIAQPLKQKQKKDARWNLINYFVEAVRILKPDVISMENVRGITKTDVFGDFVEEIKNLGYEIDFDVVYCPDYGIPQNRSRLVFLGSKLGKIQVPKKTHTKEIILPFKK